MLSRSPVVVTSVEPLEGHEGTIVTLKGSGFEKHGRNIVSLLVVWARAPGPRKIQAQLN
jgi:hypothetical protein